MHNHESNLHSGACASIFRQVIARFAVEELEATTEAIHTSFRPLEKIAMTYIPPERYKQGMAILVPEDGLDVGRYPEGHPACRLRLAHRFVPSK